MTLLVGNLFDVDAGSNVLAAFMMTATTAILLALDKFPLTAYNTPTLPLYTEQELVEMDMVVGSNIRRQGWRKVVRDSA